jgi:hypothetical protein
MHEMSKTRLEAFSDGVIAIIIGCVGPASVLKIAVGRDWKGHLSPVLYVIAIAAAFWSTRVAQAIYVSVALLGLGRDGRIEHALRQRAS